MKDENLGKVYQYIYRNRASSRQAISADLGFSLPTVAQYLNRLREDGLIYNSGEFESTGGRKANMLSIVPDARYSMGIDITHSYVSFVLVDLELTILYRIKVLTPYQDSDDFYGFLHNKIEEILDLNQIDRSRFLGVGISLPAIIGEEQKSVIFAQILDLPDDLYERLARWIPYPMLMFNDANSAGWAEIWMRNDSKSLVYLSLSDSVGGAIVMNRRVYTGNHWRGGEFGHMTVVPHGRKCYCGKRGCLDAYCSATVLSDFTEGDLDLFFHKLKYTDNPGYRRIFDEFRENLAVAVNNLRMCFDCEVVLGGNVGAFMEEKLDDFRAEVSELTPFEDNADYIQTGLCRTEPSAVGAALYFVDQFVREEKI